jgi:uncharacterized protein YdeI (YjbR/CyaY-like superfamily)
MTAFDRAPSFQAETRDAWRRWLELNHATSTGVWLVTWKRSTGRPQLEYEAAVEEALCFGWIDGQAGQADEERHKQYFSPRRAGSGWSRPNKERIARLQEAGSLAPAGLAAIERARADGSWTILDAVERLEVPDDLAAALDARPPARANWEAFPRSVKRLHLARIAVARREATRSRYIGEIADAAARNERAYAPRRD